MSRRVRGALRVMADIPLLGRGCPVAGTGRYGGVSAHCRAVDGEEGGGARLCGRRGMREMGGRGRGVLW